jgi:hypothetical protein
VKYVIRAAPILVALALFVSFVLVQQSGVAIGATGVVDFKKTTDATKALAWANQGASVTIEIVDSDLNRPLKRVLVPGDLTNLAASILLGDLTGLAGPPTASTTALSVGLDFSVAQTAIAVGDTILVDGETVREVATVVSATAITVTTPFTLTKVAAPVAEVTNPDGSFDKCPDCAQAFVIQNTAVSNSQTQLRTQLLNLVDTNVGSALANRFTSAPDTALNVLDLHIVRDGLIESNATISGLDLGIGTLTVGKIDTVVAGAADLNVLYWTATANAIAAGSGLGTVKVTSDADPVGFAINLEETGPRSGIFRTSVGASLDVSLTATASVAGTASLKVNEFDTVKATYADEGTTAGSTVTRTKSLRVETSAPAFSGQSPANDSSSTSPLPTVFGNVTDTDSGVDKDTITVIFAVDSDVPPDGIADTAEFVAVVSADQSDITAGKSLSQRLPVTLSLVPDNVVSWWIRTTDVAGNVGISDRQATIDGVADTCDPTVPAFASFTALLAAGDVSDDSTVIGKCQAYRIKVDNTAPAIDKAVTGSWWDTNKTGTDKTETDVTKSKNTFIRVDFNENVDGTTVSAADFNVAGSNPISATHFSGAKKSVFLEVSALAADARPKIEVVREILDEAGNKLTSDSLDSSSDGIAPTLTLSITEGTRPVTKDKVQVVLSADEKASTANTNIIIVPVKGFTHASAFGDESALTLTGGPTAWTASAEPSGDGLYNVDADATDLNSTTNIGKAGTDPFTAKTLAPTLTCSTTGVANVFTETSATATAGPFADQNDDGEITAADFTVTLQDADTTVAILVDDPEAGDLTITCTGPLATATVDIAYTRANPIDLAKATLFEVDTVVADPAFPLTAGGTDDPNTFIAVDFTDEGREYGLLVSKAFVLLGAYLDPAAVPPKTGADIKTSFDSHKTVELLSASLDGTDIKADVSSIDSITFLYKASGLTFAEHTLVVKVKDEAGNEKEFTHKFDVKARASVKVSLVPGWNLVSLPGEPADSSIDAVLAKSPDVSTVITYDPTIPGGFLVAVRGSGGTYSGTLETMDASHGYWVLTSTFAPIELDIPPLAEGSAGVLPPTISIAKGWNLVPIIDISGTKGVGDLISSRDYFASAIDIAAVYFFDTIANSWTFIDKSLDTEAEAVTVGRAYWVFSTKAGSLVPVPKTPTP